MEPSGRTEYMTIWKVIEIDRYSNKGPLLDVKKEACLCLKATKPLS